MVGSQAVGLAGFWTQAARAWERLALAALLAVSMAINLMVAAAEIFVAPEYRFPLWSAVFDLRFRRGDMRTWPSEWLGWTTWHGLYLYLAIALPSLAWLIVKVRRGSA